LLDADLGDTTGYVGSRCLVDPEQVWGPNRFPAGALLLLAAVCHSGFSRSQEAANLSLVEARIVPSRQVRTCRQVSAKNQGHHQLQARDTSYGRGT